MSTQAVYRLTGICGLLGVVILISGFSLNPGPPVGASVSQVIVFEQQHRTAILLGGWMQDIGALLCIAFLVAVVVIAGWASRIAALLTLLGGTILVVVSLIEVTWYLLTLQGAASGNAAQVALSLELVKAIQHAYSMIAAPAVFIPIGVVILGSRVLPRAFAYLAFLLGGVFLVLGGVVLFDDSLQGIVNVLSAVQGLWFLAAAIAVLVASRSVAKAPTADERVDVGA